MGNWNLNALYKNDKELEDEVENIEEKAKNFYNVYKGNIKNLESLEFLESLREYELLSKKLANIMTYAFLKFSTDSSKSVFFAKYQDRYTKISEKTLFFELEFNKLSKSKQNMLISVCKKYEYTLRLLQAQKPYQVSQKEEEIMLKYSVLGASAFSRLFDEHFSKLTFSYDGKKLSEEKILALLYSSDRKSRKMASISLTKGLRLHQDMLAYILNMVKKDLKIECEIRGYKSPEAPRHQENQITQKSVNSLINSAQKEFSLVHEYYDIKRDILGYENLYDYDRYAPLDDKQEVYTYDKSRQIVLKAFGEFSPRFRDIAQKAFEDGWIDVYPKSRKRGGAFSHPATSDAHPFVLLNYTDQRRDLFTLSHELGHAIHQYLSYDVGYLASDTPLTTAETASVFAEMLVFDSVKNSLSNDRKLSLLGGKLEDIFATLFRQINFTTFERRIHDFDGEVPIKMINKIWMEENKKMFGKSVVLGQDYELWWSYIPHFIHSPFYCYAYSYGQLLVLALYGLYKSGTCKDFVTIYTKFLSLGGSKSPKELVGMFGFDIESELFWKIGLKEIRNMLDEFKGLANARKTS